MNGQTKRYDKYLQSLDSLCGPYAPDEIPQIKIDLRGLSQYAKSVGKHVVDLSDSEKQPYVLNATMSELESIKIKI